MNERDDKDPHVLVPKAGNWAKSSSTESCAKATPENFTRDQNPRNPVETMNRKPIPPHPGEILREYLGGIPVTEAARTLGVSHTTLSRILSGKSGISPDMSIRLSLALRTSPELWAGMQLKFDLHQAEKLKRPRIKPFVTEIKDKSVLELKGMLVPPAGMKVSIDDMRVTLPANTVEWGAASPVGREFGSPVYERMEKLDVLALEVLGSVKKMRSWLDAPHPELEGLTPEESARAELGFRQVMRLLQRMRKAKKNPLRTTIPTA